MNCLICGNLCKSIDDRAFSCRGDDHDHYFFKDNICHTKLRIEDLCICINHYSNYIECWRGTSFTGTRHKSKLRINGTLNINPQNILQIKDKLNTYLLFS